MSKSIFKDGERIGYYYCTSIGDNEELLYKVFVEYVALPGLYTIEELREYCKNQKLILKEKDEDLF